jgi:hypothetical protein
VQASFPQIEAKLGESGTAPVSEGGLCLLVPTNLGKTITFASDSPAARHFCALLNFEPVQCKNAEEEGALLALAKDLGIFDDLVVPSGAISAQVSERIEIECVLNCWELRATVAQLFNKLENTAAFKNGNFGAIAACLLATGAARPFYSMTISELLVKLAGVSSEADQIVRGAVEKCVRPGAAALLM